MAGASRPMPLRSCRATSRGDSQAWKPPGPNCPQPTYRGTGRPASRSRRGARPGPSDRCVESGRGPGVAGSCGTLGRKGHPGFPCHRASPSKPTRHRQRSYTASRSPSSPELGMPWPPGSGNPVRRMPPRPSSGSASPPVTHRRATGRGPARARPGDRVAGQEGPVRTTPDRLRGPGRGHHRSRASTSGRQELREAASRPAPDPGRRSADGGAR